MGEYLSGDNGDQSARVSGAAHSSSAVLDILVQRRYLNNRAEHCQRPTRQREQRMQGFGSPGHAQRFLSGYGPIAQHFRPRRHLIHAPEYREEMGKDSTLSRTSGLFPPLYKTDDPGSHPPCCSLVLSTGNKLTMPQIGLK
jgi:hypothetical protein